MIPILYYRDETEFTSNGLGRLADIISAVVSEERNGIYECEFKYPLTGVHFDDIKEGMIISCTHDEAGDRQPFVIYRRSAPLDGVVTFNAHHISYELNNVILEPFSAVNISQAFIGLKTHAITENRFTFITNRSVAGTFKVTAPSSVRQVLGGQQGSILDVYGASDYEFDNFIVRLYQNRGADNGVTIRYGKNLTELTQTIDDDTFNAIIPYWLNSETGAVVYGDLNVGSGIPLKDAYWTDENNLEIRTENDDPLEFSYYTIKAVAYDFSDQFENKPTIAQLNTIAQNYLANNQPWIPSENLVVNFAAMWQTDEYADYAALQRVKLCDTVHIIYNQLGVNASAKVIRVDWNVLKECYDSIELGKPRSDFASTLLAETENRTIRLLRENDGRTYNAMQAAIENATNQLTGNNGGSHIVFTLNEDGGMEEMFIMDTDSVSTAQNVWRYNSAGWGHSTNGKEGPYTLAATQDGSILADFITAGVLQGYNDSNYWDLTNGEFVAEQGRIADFDIWGGGLQAYTYDSPYDDTVTITPSVISFSHEFHYPGDHLSDGYYVTMDYSGFHLKYFDEDIDTIYRETLAIESYGGTGFQIRAGSGNTCIGYTLSNDTVQSWTNWQINANFKVSSGYTKSKEISTDDYSKRLLYCYETASPMFGDVGEGQIGEDGKCFIWLEPIFAETINTSQYQVFLQAYGDGKAYVSERHPGYFVVEGTAGLAFGWELKARQGDLDAVRLKDDTLDYVLPVRNFGKMAEDHLKDILKERGIV